MFYNRKYNTSPGRGIENVLFKNITYTGTHANLSVIAGYDDAREIKNIIFENLGHQRHLDFGPHDQLADLV